MTKRERVYDHVLDAIGNTPIVKLNKVVGETKANVYAKLEFMNPGGSIKDRLGYWLIKDAEERGTLAQGGTIIEGTSGNTGVGLAITSAIKGYKCVFVLPDKMSQEKIKNLRAFGAKVIVTPTAVEPEDPRSYYSVSKRLAKETPNSIYMDQYNNLANRDCHYNCTGPEILKQMPDIDVLIAGIGTGGTICGTGKYLKEHKKDVEIVAVDAKGSIVYEYFKTGKVTQPAESYLIEGIGEDFIPDNYDFSVVDDMVQVGDKESFLKTREMLTKEGIYCGVSCGSAVQGAIKWIQEQGDRLNGKNILVILPDSGNRYLSKVYDDDWMREQGFLNEKSMGTVEDFLNRTGACQHQIYMAGQNDKISDVIETMKSKGFSQMPVKDDQGWIKGVVTENQVLNAMISGDVNSQDTIESLIDSSIEFVHKNDPVEKITHLVIDGKTPLVVNQNEQGQVLAIITKIDLITFMGNENDR